MMRKPPIHILATLRDETTMAYLISLGVGMGIGLLYSLLRVQSPAPPLIALLGLLGMVIGEHAIPTIKSQLAATNPAIEQVHAADTAKDATARPAATLVSDTKAVKPPKS